jgi:hypothetical protein
MAINALHPFGDYFDQVTPGSTLPREIMQLS